METGCGLLSGSQGRGGLLFLPGALTQLQGELYSHSLIARGFGEREEQDIWSQTAWIQILHAPLTNSTTSVREQTRTRGYPEGKGRKGNTSGGARFRLEFDEFHFGVSWF